jgi:hypothetical protein
VKTGRNYAFALKHKNEVEFETKKCVSCGK